MHRRHSSVLLTALLPAGALLYLGLRDGGYDVSVQQQTAIVLWYAILLGLVLGAFSREEQRRSTFVAGALLAAFACWVGLSILWSDAPDASSAELDLVVLYLALFTIVALLQMRARREAWLGGIALGIGGLVGLAALSRMFPAVFPSDEASRLLPDALGRLAYPIGYWNGLSYLAAASLPLLLHVGARARRSDVRMLAVGFLPLPLLVVYLTLSRGGLLAAAIGALLYLALSPARGQVLLALVIGLGGGVALMVKAGASPELTAGLTETGSARAQGAELGALALLVIVAVAGFYRMLELRGSRLPSGRAGRRTAKMLMSVPIAVVAAGVIALATPGHLRESFDRFQSPVLESSSDSSSNARLASISSHGRYQFWETSLEAFGEHPIRGSGAGTWEYWWAREGALDLPFYVRNAHSLFMDTIAELGIVGLLLILAFIGYPITVGVQRWRYADPAGRAFAAALLAVLVVIGVGLALDWAWKLPAVGGLWVLTVALLTGSAASPETPTRAELRSDRYRMNRYSIGSALVVLAWLAIVAEAIPMVSSLKIEQSQAAARAGRLDEALKAAQTAATIQPWAARPKIQLALIQVKDQQNWNSAVFNIYKAIERSPVDWRNWVVAAQIMKVVGRSRQELAVALSKARALNPRSKAIPTLDEL